jgi:hypothetical protein
MMTLSNSDLVMVRVWRSLTLVLPLSLLILLLSYLPMCYMFPSNIKPLISISQLTHDNHAYIEFHPDLCFVKDQTSKKILLKRVKHNRLYLVFSSLHALVCRKESNEL